MTNIRNPSKVLMFLLSWCCGSWPQRPSFFSREEEGKAEKREVPNKLEGFPPTRTLKRVTQLPPPLPHKTPTHPPALHTATNREKTGRKDPTPCRLSRLDANPLGNRTAELRSRRSAWGSTRRFCSCWRRPWRFSPRWVTEEPQPAAGSGRVGPRAQTRRHKKARC